MLKSVCTVTGQAQELDWKQIGVQKRSVVVSIADNICDENYNYKKNVVMIVIKKKPNLKNKSYYYFHVCAVVCGFMQVNSTSVNFDFGQLAEVELAEVECPPARVSEECPWNPATQHKSHHHA